MTYTFIKSSPGTNFVKIAGQWIQPALVSVIRSVPYQVIVEFAGATDDVRIHTDQLPSFASERAADYVAYLLAQNDEAINDMEEKHVDRVFLAACQEVLRGEFVFIGDEAEERNLVSKSGITIGHIFHDAKEALPYQVELADDRQWITHEGTVSHQVTATLHQAQGYLLNVVRSYVECATA
jgi:hypothetical protein